MMNDIERAAGTISEARALPQFIEDALREFGLFEFFVSRQEERRYAYIEWVTAPGRLELRQERLAQLLDELAAQESSPPQRMRIGIR